MLVSIREATLQDVEVLSKLSAETFFETYSWYNTAENMREYTEKYFSIEQTKRDLLERETHFFLAYYNAEVIGYAKLRVIEHPKELTGKKHIEIERIYVQKKYQDKKAGYALIKKCIEFSAAKKYEIIWLGVWEKNQKALGFYTRVGFEKFGVHTFQLGDDAQKDYLMQLDLTK